MSKLRLLIVDDSAYNRRNIADIFAGHPDVEVVGKATDGEEALRLATMLHPDVITLDLEMPRMDGFTFLRILMSKQPTPVIVVSSYAQKENVFKALELGALDFVTKPDQKISPEARDLKEQILSKVLALRTIKPKLIRLPPTRRMPSGIFSDGDVPSSDGRPSLKWSGDYAPRWIVAIASSTGGPGALLDIFGRIVKTIPAAFVVAQHMPDKFTRTFAERLAKRGPIRFSEAQDGDRLFAKSGLVCPGRQCMEVVLQETSFYAKLSPPHSGDRYVPSGDRLLKSAAIAGPRAIGIVLTGMGDDGVEGARAIRASGGTVIAESAETAVVYGMPGAVVRAGLASKEMTLTQIAEFLATLG
jgi:two-component system, chemotaxis family, protein-glutamate methylesterase/glutaminase